MKQTIGTISADTWTEIRIDLDKLASNGVVITCWGTDYRLSAGRLRWLLRLVGRKER